MLLIIAGAHRWPWYHDAADQWALADKRMHINNNWWRQKRRLVKSASCNYVTGNLFAKHSIYCSAIASQDA
uniref:Uncharacterized protein n=1 Tax=Oryza nivara TaxID=4536 RepID=A0A0E0H386_ORYNI